MLKNHLKMYKLVAVISLLACISSGSSGSSQHIEHYAEQPVYPFEQYPQHLAPIPDRQFDTGDPTTAALAVGAANLAATGVAWWVNRIEIEDLKDRVSKLETILSSTCTQLKTLTSVTGTPNDATANAAILTNLLAVTDPSCSA